MIELRKTLMISVIIPAFNEQEHIGNVIKTAKKIKEIDEIIVVDDGSTDATVEIAKKFGAKIILSRKNGGKGSAMKLGSERAIGDVLLFLDADLKNVNTNKIRSMIEPFRHMVDFVKTRFDRNAGRVTLLTAKPLLEHFFPEVAQRFEQPLSGQIGIKKDIFDKLTLEQDYGVDVGILIDVVEMKVKTEEVNFGYLEHNEKVLEDLDKMAKQVAGVILNRATKYDRLNDKPPMIDSQYA
ncbi:MAG TPA: glycosyltransferase [Candidatus Nitrosotalea sp.]|nr:glycosyltransferase [Candidatus Nitrosotalea sp.]